MIIGVIIGQYHNTQHTQTDILTQEVNDLSTLDAPEATSDSTNPHSRGGINGINTSISGGINGYNPHSRGVISDTNPHSHGGVNNTDPTTFGGIKGTGPPISGGTDSTNLPSLGTSDSTDTPSLRTTDDANTPNLRTTDGNNPPNLGTTDQTDSPSLGTTDGTNLPSLGAIGGTNPPKLGTTDHTDSPSFRTIDYTDTTSFGTTDGINAPSLVTTDGTNPPSLGTTDRTDTPSPGANDGANPQSLRTTDGTNPSNHWTTDGTNPPTHWTTDGTNPPTHWTTDGTNAPSLGTTESTNPPILWTTKTARKCLGKPILLTCKENKVIAIDDAFYVKESIAKHGEAFNSRRLPAPNKLNAIDAAVQTSPAQDSVITFSGQGNGPGQFHTLKDIAVSSTNEIFVADWYNRRIQVFSMKGDYLRTFRKGLLKPCAITTGRDDTLWVVFRSHRRSNDIRQYSKEGRVLARYSCSGDVIHGIAWHELSHRIILITRAEASWFDPSYTLRKSTQTCNIVTFSGGRVRYLKHVTVDKKGNIFITSDRDSRVYKYDKNGNYISSFGSPGTEAGDLSNPYGITVDSLGRVLVVDQFNSRVEMFTAEGGHIGTLAYLLSPRHVVTAENEVKSKWPEEKLVNLCPQMRRLVVPRERATARARIDMTAMDPSKVGSWKRAVMSGDGVYHARGYHRERSAGSCAPLHARERRNHTAHPQAAEGYGFELIWEELKDDVFTVDGDFHSDRRCSCKNCSPLDIKCNGKSYTTSHPLTCPMHSMAYTIEARNNVLIRYRSKSISLNRLAYWNKVAEVAMELPIPEGVVENVRKRNEASMQKLHGDNKDGQGHGKKVARAMEEEERKRLNKSGHVQLTYGDEEVEDRDEDAAYSKQNKGTGQSDDGLKLGNLC
ncbi:hypothetical protein Bbelb_374150 [Branchiostoma belcheri]|nr:hypothetical protein Bbelb_374150 [Branchiostoma belcheri]